MRVADWVPQLQWVNVIELDVKEENSHGGGEVSACAGSITDSTIGFVQVLGMRVLVAAMPLEIPKVLRS